nr:hypothetical protein CFP56_11442 [Quercus suber]
MRRRMVVNECGLPHSSSEEAGLEGEVSLEEERICSSSGDMQATRVVSESGRAWAWMDHGRVTGQPPVLSGRRDRLSNETSGGTQVVLVAPPFGAKLRAARHACCREGGEQTSGDYWPQPRGYRTAPYGVAQPAIAVPVPLITTLTSTSESMPDVTYRTVSITQSTLSPLTNKTS